MLSNCKKYMLTNLCGLMGCTVILSMIFHYVGNDFMVLPTIILGIFFCVANTVSIFEQGPWFAFGHSIIRILYICNGVGIVVFLCR